MKKVSLIVEKTTIDIYEFYEDEENKIRRLSPPLTRASHRHRSMGISYRWEEDGKPVVLKDIYNDSDG